MKLRQSSQGLLFISLLLNLFIGPATSGDPFVRLENDAPKLFIAGNSTASNGAENGWGSHLQKYFDSDNLTVVNRARGGRSSRTFITEGLWDNLLKDLNTGDYVIIEFGHNDAGPMAKLSGKTNFAHYPGKLPLKLRSCSSICEI